MIHHKNTIKKKNKLKFHIKTNAINKKNNILLIYNYSK